MGEKIVLRISRVFFCTATMQTVMLLAGTWLGERAALKFGGVKNDDRE